jgi:hypothetical protein
MIRNRITYPLGVWMLGLAWLSGCSHTANLHNAATPVPAAPATHPVTPPGAQAIPSATPTPNQQSSEATAMAPNSTVWDSRPAQEVAVATKPKAEAAPQPVTKHEETLDTAAAPAPELPAVPEKPKRSPLFGHADDYQWLRGQVEISRLSTGCRLRFADMDEEDPHGGSVTLTGDSRLRGLQDGAYVHVSGHLVNPGDKGTAPAYHVDRFEIIPQPAK